MNALLWVDGFYVEFCNSFSGPLREEARRLSFTLKLAPEPNIPWSHVFNHEVTLAAPSMAAEAMPGVLESAVKHALFAHMLAVIEAIGTDRIEDGQIVATPGLRRILQAARTDRDEHLALAAGGEPLALDPVAVDRELVDGVRTERDLLLGGRQIDLPTYETVSALKQGPGVVASVVLAGRAGWGARKREVLRRALQSVALGLQVYDDVLDWEDDAERGRSWALALARSERGPNVRRWGLRPHEVAAADSSAWRKEIYGSGVLAKMLRRSRLHFRAGARRAKALGALRLAAWADERAVSLSQLAEREAHSPGFVSRALSLSPWARAMLGPNA